jgi:VanZ family protein
MQTRSGRHLRNPRIWQVALAVYWLTLLVGTHLPRETPLLPGRWFDKLIHLVAFALLATLFAVTWQRSARSWKLSRLFLIWIILALYAALDEWTQTYVGRQASAADWLADASGAALGLVLFALSRWLPEPR